MSVENKRRHTRVPITARVDIQFEDDERLCCETRDLCLSGMLVCSGQHRTKGDPCQITFITRNRPLRLRGEVARVDGGGMALLFTDMNLRTYTSLQEVLLDNAENPFAVAEEFIDSLPADQ
ncbi:MAG: PilZ domain-containing protein [Thermodesulfobacteriota bacterium]